MTTDQPSYWCVANIKDQGDPFEHGGGFVLVDRTGIYTPELLILEHLSGSVGECQHQIETILLDRVTRIKHENGLDGLSDNNFHPDHEAWFGNPVKLLQQSKICDATYEGLLMEFLAESPVVRALAYMDAVRCWGASSFTGNEPRMLTPEKAKLLCDTMLNQIKESKTWHQGWGVSCNG
jgi:hypothetical protein